MSSRVRRCFALAIGAVACVVGTPTVGARTASWRGSQRRVERIDRSSRCLLPGRPFGSYGWPVKPFDEPHAVRGNFGDPRTLFFGGLQGGPAAPGYFRFHNGVDISAPDGSPVYPVVSGRVLNMAADHLAVRTNDRRHFQYWHIRPSVRAGQPVVAGQTVLGHILPRQEHVHLTEIDGLRVTNPLFPGHLFPYRDDKPPRVDSLHFLGADGAQRSGPTLAGTVSVTAAAHDDPSLRPPGHWHDAVVTPAVIKWWLSRADGTLVLPPRTVFDVRRRLPAERMFWRIFAPGTFQNFPVSALRHLTATGNYVFRIGALRTDELADGRYTLTVQAGDVCGNTGALTTSFEVKR